MNREQHLQWCKDRANAYIDQGQVQEAGQSMLSDMRKHAETENHLALELMFLHILGGHLSGGADMRDFINGFN